MCRLNDGILVASYRSELRDGCAVAVAKLKKKSLPSSGMHKPGRSVRPPMEFLGCPNVKIPLSASLMGSEGEQSSTYGISLAAVVAGGFRDAR